MASQKTRRQHVLPQFLIRRFADADTGEVVAYDRKYKMVLPRKQPKSIAYEWDYLTLDPPDSPGSTWIEDEALVVPDHRGAQLVERIVRRRAVSPDDVPMTREFIALLHMRGPELRRLAEKAVRHGNDAFALAQSLPNLRSVPDSSDITGHLSKKADDDSDELLGRNEVIRMQMGRTPKLLQILEQHPWNYSVVSIQHPRFVTSDNPIVARHAVTGRFASISSIGLRHASEFWLVLDPRCALVLSAGWPQGQILTDLSLHGLHQVNTAVAQASDRWTIWQPGSGADQCLDLPA